MNNTQYDAIIRTYEEKQNKNRHLLEERRAHIYAHVDGYKEMDDSIASISVEQGRKLLEGNESAISELKHLLRSLSESKASLLAASGFPADYLEPVYDCPDCKDTGYIDGRKCHCFRQAEISLLYEQSNISRILEKENFSTLSDEYYQGEDLSRFRNAVEECKKFVQNFGFDYHNLFFMVQWEQVNRFFPDALRRNCWKMAILSSISVPSDFLRHYPTFLLIIKIKKNFTIFMKISINAIY